MRFTRRRFLAFGAAADGDVDRFGGRITVGAVEDVRDQVAAGSGAMYVAVARSWIVPGEGGEPFLALYQKCTHLGWRVPWCASSTRRSCRRARPRTS